MYQQVKFPIPFFSMRDFVSNHKCRENYLLSKDPKKSNAHVSVRYLADDSQMPVKSGLVRG